MKRIVLFLTTLFVGFVAFAGTWTLNRSKISVGYNLYGAEDYYGNSIQWQAGNAGVLPDAVASATGNRSWTPTLGEKFMVTLSGTSNMTGTLQVFIADERDVAGYWTQLSERVGQVEVTAGKSFNFEFVFSIDKTETESYYGDIIDLTVPDLVLSYSYPGTSEDYNFDPSEDFVISNAKINILYAEAPDYSDPISLSYNNKNDDGSFVYQEIFSSDIASAQAGQYVNLEFEGVAKNDIDSLVYVLVDGSEYAGWWFPMTDECLLKEEIKKGDKVSVKLSYKISESSPSFEPILKDVLFAKAENKSISVDFSNALIRVSVTDAPKFRTEESVQEPEEKVKFYVDVTTNVPEHLASDYYVFTNGSGYYEQDSYATIEAISKSVYEYRDVKKYIFKSWNDGNTENPRTIRVEEDVNFIAEFETLCEVNVDVEFMLEGIEIYEQNEDLFDELYDAGEIDEGDFGLVSIASYSYDTKIGEGENACFPYKTQVTITAIPGKFAHFVQWSDGNTQNPRTLTLNSDFTIDALFDIDTVIFNNGSTYRFPNPLNKEELTLRNFSIVTEKRSDYRYRDTCIVMQSNLRENLVSYFTLDKGVLTNTQLGDNASNIIFGLQTLDDGFQIFSGTKSQNGIVRYQSTETKFVRVDLLSPIRDFEMLTYEDFATDVYEYVNDDEDRSGNIAFINEKCQGILILDSYCFEFGGDRINDVEVVFHLYIKSSDGEESFYNINVSFDKDLLIVPDSISYKGNSYPVTSIDAKFEEDNKTLKTVSIGKNVKEIKEDAFSNCSAITKVYCYAVTPPKISNNTFYNTNSYLYVPCESIDVYDSHPIWGNFKHIECISTLEKEFTVVLSSSNITMGSVKGEGFYKENTTATLIANPASGYKFVKWSDGNSDNPRVITVTADVEYTAIFEIVSSSPKPTEFTVSLSSSDNAMGSVMGAGSYEKDATATLIAIPASGYNFVKWNDGNIENPRVITISKNVEYVAEFAQASGNIESEYTITVVASDNSMGTIVGAGKYEVGATAILAAVASKGYQFVQWNDGNNDNPRMVTVTENMFLVATFEKISTAIEDVEVKDEITIVNHQIFVNGEAPEFVTTVLGQRIANKNLKSGIYFVQSGNKQIGVSVR